MLLGERLVVVALVATCAVIPAWSQPAAPAAGPGDAELRVKTAFVFQFPQFVVWPSPAMLGRTSFDFCVYQSPAVAAFLETLAAGDAIAGRPIRVIAKAPGGDVTTCHAIAAIGPDDVSAALKQVADRPVLTIGDGDRFLERGGIIALRVVDRRVRFAVSVENAQRSGLQLSSHLLRLALSGPGEPR